jgi:hypothetical protein
MFVVEVARFGVFGRLGVCLANILAVPLREWR